MEEQVMGSLAANFSAFEADGAGDACRPDSSHSELAAASQAVPASVPFLSIIWRSTLHKPHSMRTCQLPVRSAVDVPIGRSLESRFPVPAGSGTQSGGCVVVGDASGNDEPSPPATDA